MGLVITQARTYTTQQHTVREKIYRFGKLGSFKLLQNRILEKTWIVQQRSKCQYVTYANAVSHNLIQCIYILNFKNYLAGLMVS